MRITVPTLPHVITHMAPHLVTGLFQSFAKLLGVCWGIELVCSSVGRHTKLGWVHHPVANIQGSQLLFHPVIASPLSL